ncbi:carbohydrate kinase family protein [Patescibacteria group bacterium]
MQVIVTGSLSYDFIMNFSGRFADRIMPDKIHCISLSFLADKLNKQLGGTAGNIAYTLNLLGIKPNIVACAGGDFDIYKKFLQKNKISDKHISIKKNINTSSYFVITDKDDNQIGSFYSGAMKRSKDLKIKDVVKKLPATSYQLPVTSYQLPAPFIIISPNDTKALVSYVDECCKNNFDFIYDPAFQIGALSSKDVKKGIAGAKIVIGNDYEIALIEKALGVSHSQLIKQTNTLITTLGPKGSIIETNAESMHIKPAKPKNTSDPTGAGDAYRGGFVAGFIRGFDLEICGQMGAVAAVYTVEKYGTVTHKYSKKQFCDRYYENYGKKLRL